MITANVAMALSIARGLIKLAGRTDRLLAEKQGVTSDLILSMPSLTDGASGLGTLTRGDIVEANSALPKTAIFMDSRVMADPAVAGVTTSLCAVSGQPRHVSHGEAIIKIRRY